MTRVSQLELYNDKDVITQICMMKQLVETGTYKDVDVQDDGAGNLVFTFTDQQDDTEVFTIPVKLISSVTSSQSGSTVTMRITWTDGTHNDYTWTAGGDVTTNTNQTISAVKTFSVSPIVPDTPSGIHAAVNVAYAESTVLGVNNILHKSGNEAKTGIFTIDNGFVANSITQIGRGNIDGDYFIVASIPYNNEYQSVSAEIWWENYGTGHVKAVALDVLVSCSNTAPKVQVHGIWGDASTLATTDIKVGYDSVNNAINLYVLKGKYGFVTYGMLKANYSASTSTHVSYGFSGITLSASVVKTAAEISSENDVVADAVIV